MSPAQSLDALAVDRNNNFNLIRATLAFMVLLHHAFMLTGNPIEAQSLVTRFLAGMGEIAVGGFFIVSGFLVTRSLFGRATVGKFCLARVLRIYPGLIVMLLVTTLLLAPFSTVPPAGYFGSVETWRYVAQNATAIFITYPLPGLFEGNSEEAVNGSLWSLRYEMFCYITLALVGLIGLARKRWVFAVGTVTLALALLLIPFDSLPYILAVARKMGFLFGLGALAAAYAPFIRMRLVYAAALFAVALLLDRTPLSTIGWSIAFAYFLLWFAYVPKGPVLAYNRLPDVSYGLYIYAFPVQQLAIQLAVGADPLSNALVAAPVTILFATASWYAIEKPALDLKNWLGRRKDPRADGGTPALSEAP